VYPGELVRINLLLADWFGRQSKNASFFIAFYRCRCQSRPKNKYNRNEAFPEIGGRSWPLPNAVTAKKSSPIVATLFTKTMSAPWLNPTTRGKFVAIDIESGMHEIDADELAAGDRLRARFPGAQIWVVRVGSRFAHRFGGRNRRERP
jgi:hypothetical protein